MKHDDDNIVFFSDNLIPFFPSPFFFFLWEKKFQRSKRTNFVTPGGRRGGALFSLSLRVHDGGGKGKGQRLGGAFCCSLPLHLPPGEKEKKRKGEKEISCSHPHPIPSIHLAATIREAAGRKRGKKRKGERDRSRMAMGIKKYHRRRVSLFLFEGGEKSKMVGGREGEC